MSTPADCVKRIRGHLAELGSRYEVSGVFEDFVELAALEYVQTAGRTLPEVFKDAEWHAREARYMDIVKQYQPDEIRGAFASMFNDLVLATVLAEEAGEMQDPLGELYEETVAMAVKFRGQYLSPPALCLLMAEMNLGETADVLALVEARGFVSVADPACGSGRMLLAAAHVLRHKGVDPTTRAWFSGQDSSPLAVHMAYVNLSLRGLAGVIVYGDTLRMETRQVWHTTAFLLDAWSSRIRAADYAATLELASHAEVQLDRLRDAEAAIEALQARLAAVETQAAAVAEVVGFADAARASHPRRQRKDSPRPPVLPPGVGAVGRRPNRRPRPRTSRRG